MFVSDSSPLTARRLQVVRSNRRGWWSIWIFMVLFVVSLFAEFVAIDEPLRIYYKQSVYLPIFKAYPEKTFGGEKSSAQDREIFGGVGKGFCSKEEPCQEHD